MLNDAKIKNAKPRQKAYKVFDELGLYLLISPSGSKGWRFKYKFGGREKLLLAATRTSRLDGPRKSAEKLESC